jgi:hypothetical protein
VSEQGKTSGGSPSEVGTEAGKRQPIGPASVLSDPAADLIVDRLVARRIDGAETEPLTCPAPVLSSQLASELARVYRDMAANSVDLDQESAAVLYEHLWDLI